MDDQKKQSYLPFSHKDEERKEPESVPAGLQGFICPKTGEKKRFRFCQQDCGDRCEPLPILLSLGYEWEKKPNQYHVTEILNPPQIVWLSRHNTWYEYPEDLIWRTYGQAWHKVMETGVRFMKTEERRDWILEDSFKDVLIRTKEGTVELRGRPDLYHIPTKTLYDYKTTKWYSVMLIKKEGWKDSTMHLQVNIYKRYKFPEAQKLIIKALVKDYTHKDCLPKQIKSIETLEVPMMQGQAVDKLVEEKIEEILKNEKDPTTIKECTASDRWKRDGRCFNYCAVVEFCPQFKRRWGYLSKSQRKLISLFWSFHYRLDFKRREENYFVFGGKKDYAYTWKEIARELYQKGVDVKAIIGDEHDKEITTIQDGSERPDQEITKAE